MSAGIIELLLLLLVQAGVLSAVFAFGSRKGSPRGAPSLLCRFWGTLIDVVLTILVARLLTSLLDTGTFGLATRHGAEIGPGDLAPHVLFGTIFLLARDWKCGRLSPGKRILGYRVVGRDGENLGFRAICLRNLPLCFCVYGHHYMAFLSGVATGLYEYLLAVACGIVILLILLSDLWILARDSQSRRLGDRLAKTRAVCC